MGLWHGVGGMEACVPSKMCGEAQNGEVQSHTNTSLQVETATPGHAVLHPTTSYGPEKGHLLGTVLLS